MHPILIRRSLGALLALIVSSLLFLIWDNGSTGRLARRQLVIEDSLVLNSSSATNASRLLSRHDISLKHSNLHTSHITKRALSYHDAACKGRQLLGWIAEVHEGKRTPAAEFGQKDIDNGWSKEGFPRIIPSAFDEPFKAIGKSLENVGERIPTLSETFHIDLVQNKPFRNSFGQNMKPIPQKDNQGAHYEVYYVPLWNAMISSDARSPRHQVQVNYDFKAFPNLVDKLIPPLNRQSDVMWTVWKTVSPTPNDLRYICRDGVVNPDTKGIMNEVFSKGPTRKPVPWPGLTFGIDTEEAQALLGTPNGLAVAFTLMDRAKELGRRKLSVTIFATDPELGQGYRMLWDMAPWVLTLSLPPAGLGLTFTSDAGSPASSKTAATTATKST